MAATATIFFNFTGSEEEKASTISGTNGFGIITPAAYENQSVATMRRLLQQHCTWTRTIIFNVIDGLPGGEQTIKNLLHNIGDIVTLLRRTFGEIAGTTFSDLLHNHVFLTVEMLKALRTDNFPAYKKASDAIYLNAGEIVGLIGKINRTCILSDVKKSVNGILFYIQEQALSRRKKDYDNDTRASQNIEMHVNELAEFFNESVNDSTLKNISWKSNVAEFPY